MQKISVFKALGSSVIYSLIHGPKNEEVYMFPYNYFSKVNYYNCYLFANQTKCLLIVLHLNKHGGLECSYNDTKIYMQLIS